MARIIFDNEDELRPMPPLPVSAEDQPDSCGIDGWKPSENVHTGRFPEFGMGEAQCGDSRPECPDCDEEDEGA